MQSSGRTLVCSVLFLDIVEYSKKPVAEQLQIKQPFTAALARALEPVAPRDRIILDTGDGAAITFMGDPEDALFAAMTVRDGAGAVPVRLGVNLGPVRLVKDLNGQMNIIGDGINVAQRVMSFSRPGQLLVSRSFYEVVSCLSRDYARLFLHEGSRTDKHVRDHEVYSVVGGGPSPRRLGDTISQSQPGGSRAGGWLRGVGPLGLRRTALLAAPIVFLFLIAGAVAARALFSAPTATPTAPPRMAAIPEPAAKAAPTPEPAAPKSDAAPAQQKKTLARTVEKKIAKPAGPAKLELVIAPWGEVLIDGKSRGVTPPLRTVELAAGAHPIQHRNPHFPAHRRKEWGTPAR